VTSRAELERRLERALRLQSVDVEAYASARLGSMGSDPWVHAELERRWAEGWEERAAVDDVSHRVPARMFDLALERAGPAGTILDFGAGSGSLANFARDYTDVPNPIVAVDRVGPRQPFPPNVRTFVSDLHAFEWDGAPFDLSLCLHVFEQVPDSPGLAAKLHSLLRRGGTALFAVSDGRWAHSLLKAIWKGDDYDDVHAYTLESFRAILEGAGFEIEEWACWPSYFSIHFGHVPLPGDRDLGTLLDELALWCDRVHGTTALSCYGYALLCIAR
jgi:SAM-dependent methyltransferase